MPPETGVLRPRNRTQSQNPSPTSTDSSSSSTSIPKYRTYSTMQSFFDASRATLVRRLPGDHPFKSRVVSRGRLATTQPPPAQRTCDLDPERFKRIKSNQHRNANSKPHGWAGRAKQSSEDPRHVISQKQLIEMWYNKRSSKQHIQDYKKVKHKIDEMKVFYKLKDTDLRKRKKEKEEKAWQAEKEKKKKRLQASENIPNSSAPTQMIPMYVNKRKRKRDQFEPNHFPDVFDVDSGTRRKKRKLSDSVQVFTHPSSSAQEQRNGVCRPRGLGIMVWLNVLGRSGRASMPPAPSPSIASEDHKAMSYNYGEARPLGSSPRDGNAAVNNTMSLHNQPRPTRDGLDIFWQRDYARFFPDRYFATRG